MPLFGTSWSRKPKPPPGRASTTWPCSRCTLENVNDSSQCAACGAPAPSGAAAAVPAPYPAARPVPRATALPALPPRPAAVPPRPAPAPAAATLGDFVGGSANLGPCTFYASVILPDGTQLETTQTVDAAALRAGLRGLVPSTAAAAAAPRRPNGPAAAAPGRPNGPAAAAPGRPTNEPAIATVLPDGRTAGAADVFAANLANAGQQGGEAAARRQQSRLPADASRQSRARRGPAQLGLAENLSLDEVRAQLGADVRVRNTAGGGTGADGMGARVNASTAGPVYDNADDDFERSVFIDPSRSAARDAIDGGAPVVEVAEPPDASGSVPLAYEVAAVSAKLRNLALVAGERVREMDHFVAQVRTPVVQLVADDDAATTAAAAAAGTGAGDAGQQKEVATRRVLEDAARRHGLGASDRVKIDGDPLAPPVLAVPGLGPAGERAPPPPAAKAYGTVFWRVVKAVYSVLGRPAPTKKDVALYYLPTVRASAFVASRGGPDDPRLFLNVLAFQQSGTCAVAADGAPTDVAAAKWPSVLAYWTSRIAKVFRDGAPAAGGATGLYDADVRKRLVAAANVLAGNSAALAVPRRKAWAPPPVGDALLRASDAADAAEAVRVPAPANADDLPPPRRPPRLHHQDSLLREMFPGWDPDVLAFAAAQHGGNDEEAILMLSESEGPAHFRSLWMEL